MNMTLSNVKIVCVRGTTDTMLITPDNVKNGIWPFKGNHTFKVELPKNHAEDWLLSNFGESPEDMKIINENNKL